jgi:iron complex outermembrane recepter protein
VKVSVWAVSLSAGLIPSIAFAATEHAISIASGPLDQALVTLSRQTGVSIGMAGNLPEIRVVGFSGRMRVEAALKRLLRNSGLVAVRVGANAWRIERDALPRKKATTKAPKNRREESPPDEAKHQPQPEPPPVPIIVTAAKRTQPLESTPIASTVIDGDKLARLGLAPNTIDLAKLADGLTLTNLGPGRNRAFLRGVGDSPFNGQTQATVATILDDARIGFNAPEPELKLIDIDRIELLKGPQGPLYGTGALGGVYRIVTQSPKLDRVEAAASVEEQTLSHGGNGIAGSAILNLPLATDRIAVRAVAYKGQNPGWIDTNRPHGANSNVEHYYGGRLALKWQIANDWSATLSGAAQYLHVDDSQYTNVPGRYQRNGVAAEPHDNDFAHAQLSINGSLGAFDVVSTTSWTNQEVDSVLDASPAASVFGQTGSLLFNDDRIYTLWNQELRVSTRSGPLHALAGVSWSQANTKIMGEIERTADNPVIIGLLSEVSGEIALFGEVGYEFAPYWMIDGGLRLYRSTVDDERAEAGGIKSSAQHTGLSPSLSLSYNPDASQYYYMRIASAMRPGGLAVFSPAASASFDSDELLSLELGGRWRLPDTGLSFKMEGYAGQWSHIQSDYLLPNGLLGTRNSGDAMIYGLETSVDWKPDEHWNLEGGFELQHAKLEKAAPGLAITKDRQLPIVPLFKGHASAAYGFDIGSWKANMLGLIYYSGPTKLSLDPALDRKIGSRLSVDLNYQLAKGHWQFALGLENATDSRSDSFGFGNPFSFAATDQRTPVLPRRVAARVWYKY